MIKYLYTRFWNDLEYIPEFVAFYAKHHPNVEIIALDIGSQDGSAEEFQRQCNATSGIELLSIIPLVMPSDCLFRDYPLTEAVLRSHMRGIREICACVDIDELLLPPQAESGNRFRESLYDTAIEEAWIIKPEGFQMLGPKLGVYDDGYSKPCIWAGDVPRWTAGRHRVEEECLPRVTVGCGWKLLHTKYADVNRMAAVEHKLIKYGHRDHPHRLMTCIDGYHKFHSRNCDAVEIGH